MSSFDFLGPSIPQGDGFDASKMAVNGAAHDDTCVDRCSTLGVIYNAPQALHHRGFSLSMHTRNRHSISASNLTSLPPHMLQLGAPESAWASPSFKGVIDLPANAHIAYDRDWPSALEDGQLTSMYSSMPPPIEDEDSRSLSGSITTCNSACVLDNRCTGVGCAEESDVCIDANCPDSREVVNAATALSILQVSGPQYPSSSIPAPGK
jgi:hypothetical protein